MMYDLFNMLLDSGHFKDPFLGSQFDPTGNQAGFCLLPDCKIKPNIQDTPLHSPSLLSVYFQPRNLFKTNYL